MNEKNVDKVTRLVAARQGEHLVDSEIDGMKQETAERVADQRHETPRRIVRPVDAGRLLAPGDNGPDETRQTEFDVYPVAERPQTRAVSSERRGYASFRVVKEIEIVAAAN